MENFIISINTVLPLVVLIITGLIIKKYNYVTDSSLREWNKLVFNLFIPITLFINTANINIKESLNIELLIFLSFSVITLYIIMYYLSVLITSSKKSQGVLTMNTVRSNVLLLGLSIIGSYYNNEYNAEVSIVLATIIPLWNVLSIVVLAKKKQSTMRFKGLLIDILNNKIIIATLIGIIFSLINIELPTVVWNSLDKLAVLATPLALIILGATFEVEGIKGNCKLLFIALLLKMVVIPTIMVLIACLLDFRGFELLIIMVVFGAPNAVSSYSLAISMDSDETLASQMLLFTTLICPFTLVVGITILSNFALI